MSYIEYPYGICEDKVMYFKTSRFYPDNNYFKYANKLIGKKEIVSFDCGLFDLDGTIDIDLSCCEQILAVIINPIKDKDYKIDNRFEFCGYDLCSDTISAITNCGCEYVKAIDYEKLNKYGLINDYDEALESIHKLKEIYPLDSHADCDIIKIYRYSR